MTADYSVDASIPSVTVNREYGGYLAMRHMIQDAGRKRLAILIGMDINTDHKMKGYERALIEAGSKLEDHLVVRTSPTVTNPCNQYLHLISYTAFAGCQGIFCKQLCSLDLQKLGNLDSNQD